jgi:crotonobetainyl-CoA:carnitine CoA-transferase CaiB-like acyl-CoA transferase
MLGEWTRRTEAHPLMERLQAAGVEAGVVQEFDDLLADPQLAHRGHFQTLHHALLGDLAFEQCANRLAENPQALRTPGPNLGEHTASFLADALGLDAEEIDSLVAKGVLM